MKTKIVRVRVQESDLNAIKKRGSASGKNLSETIRDLIRSGLENRTESASCRGIDKEVVRFLAEKAARTDALLVKISARISGEDTRNNTSLVLSANKFAQIDIDKLFNKEQTE